jgi:hypothetical protein
MARHDALDEPMSGVPAPRISSGPILLSSTTTVSRITWRQLGWLAIAAAGVGFAAYLYLFPYRQLTNALEGRSRELRQERSDGHELTADRDRLKAVVEKVEAADHEKAAEAAKHREVLEAMAAQLKPPLQELGVKLSIADGRMLVSLSPDKAIDRNGIDVSGEGNAALKILAGAMKRNGTAARIKAPFGAAPAPKQLRSLFATVGEVAAVRAARVLSALESAGVAPDHLTIVGETESEAKEAPKPPPPRGGRRGRRAAMAAAAAAAAAAASSTERLDIEVGPG